MNSFQKDYTPSGPEKAEMIAQILGQPDMKFVDWKSLMGEGVVAKLHIGRTRFRTQLTYKDLGISFETKEAAKKNGRSICFGHEETPPQSIS